MKIQSFDLKTKKLARYWLFPLLWAGVIFMFSSQPTQVTSEIYWEDFFVKKSAHMFEYAVFTILTFRAFKNSGVSVKRSIIYAFCLSVLYGASDEFHQSFIPGRGPAVRDIIFDTIGAGIATLFLWKLLPIAPLRLKSWAKKLELL